MRAERLQKHPPRRHSTLLEGNRLWFKARVAFTALGAGHGHPPITAGPLITAGCGSRVPVRAAQAWPALRVPMSKATRSLSRLRSSV